MKGLTIRQPWASLVVTPRPLEPAVPLKRFETRKRNTLIRETIVISAGKRWAEEQQSLVASADFHRAIEALGVPPWDKHRWIHPPLGCIVGLVDIVDSLPTSNEGWTRFQPWVEKLPEPERILGDFSTGRYGWKLANPRPLREPIPMLGLLGFWTVPPETVEQIARQLGPLP